MERGYYYVVAADGTHCPHRHYELSRMLKQCRNGGGGTVWYVDDNGERRPIRRDEMEELAEQ